MISGLSDSCYAPHSFNMEEGMVIFRTKRERRLLEDVISWANDKVLPEREPVAGEPRKKKAKATADREGPSIGQLILQHPTIITNLRSKNADYLQGLCPLCAEVGKDSDENHFWIHESSGGYGCVSDCETSELTHSLVKVLSNAGVLQNDTSQKEEKVETDDVSKFENSNLDTSQSDEEDLAELLQEFPQYETVKEGDAVIGLRLKPVTERLDIDIPGNRIVKNTDHHIVEHVLLDDEYTRPNHTYCRIETSKATGKQDKTYIDVADINVKALWQSIVRHIMPSPVIGGTFEVSDLWDTMKMDRTKQGEKYRRWNFPSDVLILLGVLEKDGNTYTVRRAYHGFR